MNGRTSSSSTSSGFELEQAAAIARIRSPKKDLSRFWVNGAFGQGALRES